MTLSDENLLLEEDEYEQIGINRKDREKYEGFAKHMKKETIDSDPKSPVDGILLTYTKSVSNPQLNIEIIEIELDKYHVIKMMKIFHYIFIFTKQAHPSESFLIIF